MTQRKPRTLVAQAVSNTRYICGAANGNPAATKLLTHVFAAMALAEDARYISTMNATPLEKTSIIPPPIRTPDSICGTGVMSGEDVQAKTKRPAGNMKLPAIIGGKRSSGSIEPRLTSRVW